MAISVLGVIANTHRFARRVSTTFVLASASPRRRELLTQLGYRFEVIPADVDESVDDVETPTHYVARLALAKAAAVLERHPARTVLGADTTVVCGDEILGKPRGPKEGVRMLQQLSGRAHEVLTGVAVCSSLGRDVQVVVSRVHFRDLSSAEIDAYVASGEGRDKAGGYGIQAIGSIFVRHLEGSYSGVVGLPLCETELLLRRHGVEVW